MLLLIDKGYYDYDYKVVEKKMPVAEATALSDEKLNKVMTRFGFGRKRVNLKEMGIEQLQEYAIKEMKYGK